jgi:hypothetical protein
MTTFEQWHQQVLAEPRPPRWASDERVAKEIYAGLRQPEQKAAPQPQRAPEYPPLTQLLDALAMATAKMQKQRDRVMRTERDAADALLRGEIDAAKEALIDRIVELQREVEVLRAEVDATKRIADLERRLDQLGPDPAAPPPPGRRLGLQ